MFKEIVFMLNIRIKEQNQISIDTRKKYPSIGYFLRVLLIAKIY